MPISGALIIATIGAVFVVFGAVLAWAEYQTRNLSRPPQERATNEQREATTTHAKVT
jgi:hypothetical protein